MRNIICIIASLGQLVPLRAMSHAGSDDTSAVARASAVYCRGALLHAVQQTRLFADAKDFVDMPMRNDPEEILAAFQALSAADQGDVEKLRAFVQNHFDEPGTELEQHVPEEYPPEIPILPRISSPALKEFASALHTLWPTLCRVTAPRVTSHPERSSALPRKHPMVLPGGRFRETYYWDSYWIVHGLLASGMVQVAKGLVQNLLDDVSNFGFVPNGGRVYYLNRSQPPLLASMVADVVTKLDAESAKQWLEEAVPLLLREYQWWMEGDHAVHVQSTEPCHLNRYSADWDAPRPESYWQDVDTAAGESNVYRQLATGAETGWDFSSRWLQGGWARDDSEQFHLREMSTNHCLPVDLNAILYRSEVTLAKLSEALHNDQLFADVDARCSVDDAASFSSADGQRLRRAAELRRSAMNEFMLPAAGPPMVDAWLSAEEAEARRADGPPQLNPERKPTLADFAAPLWAGLVTGDSALAYLDALKASGLVGIGGVATTTFASGQQWDAPNAWPPLQAMLINGLRQTGVEACKQFAFELAQTWVGTCYAAWRTTGFMHEKYDAERFGSGGAGGEYEPQVGFGWSNGVVLQLLEEYGDRLRAPDEVEQA